MKVRVFQRPDGTVAVVYPNPSTRIDDENEGEWLARTFARTVEVDPALAGLAYTDLDDSDLPPRTAVCACGDEHSIREQWRAGKGGVPVHDESVRNLIADAHHLGLAEIAELGKDTPDPARLAALDVERRRLRLHAEGKIPEPPAEAVSALVADVIAPAKRRAR